MGPQNNFNRRKIDKRFLSKNKTIKLYKEKANKINLFKKEVEGLVAKYTEIDLDKVKKFDDFPLSDRTKRALRKCSYYIPTEIQKESIMLAFQDRDILGAAKTGSGKTLAFVIPILERLFVSGWSILDGLGALIITPTRELAYQIYEVINKVGSNHQFSVGLIIGGKDLAKERKLIDKCNIMICTPGRLLQHMDENQLFDAMNLKLLVLDEADRILDLGFAKTMNAILANLPTERQTLLFSATQTKSVKDLARLSLKNPAYVSVDELSKYTTPEALQQSFVVCEAHDKMNFIWSFIKSHKKHKILVFLASCKQVKFTFESICRLRPGVSVMALYGSLHQLRRMQIYDDFCNKNHVIMFATDVASRGLDFPNVNWVVHLDCPEDVNTYIHRAGRTARYQKGGESLLVLLPSEKDSMIKQLTDRKIPIEEIKVNPDKLFNIQKKLEAVLLRDKVLKESGIRGFKAYLKNIFLMKDKSVFDIKKIDIIRYANSLGLDFVPRIRFLERNAAGYKEISSGEMPQNSAGDVNSDDFSIKINSKVDEENADNFLNSGSRSTEDYPCYNCCTSDESDDEDLLRKREDLFVSDVVVKQENESQEMQSKSKKLLTKAALVKRELKKKAKMNTVVKYDDEGNPLREVAGQLVPDVTADLKRELSVMDYTAEKATLLLEKETALDKSIFRERVKAKHKNEKIKKKEKMKKPPAREVATLKGSDDDESGEENDQSESGDIDPNNMSLSEQSENEEQSSGEESPDDENEQSASESGDENEQSISESDTDSPGGNENSEEANDNENESEEEIKEKPIAFERKRKKKINENKADLCHLKTKKIKTDRTIEDDEQLALHFLSNI